MTLFKRERQAVSEAAASARSSLSGSLLIAVAALVVAVVSLALAVSRRD